MTKNKPAAGEWRAKTLSEFVSGNKTWRAQKLKSPSGDILYGIKAFVKKRDGSLTITNQGFTVPKDMCDAPFLKGLASLLKALNNEITTPKEK